MLCVLLLKRLRNSSSAYLFHQCLLDFLKGLYSLLLAYSVLTEQEPPHCSLLGGIFIVCVTTNAFNILAMIMSDAYVFADLAAGRENSGNYCCVLFGITTIWFAAIILNLGVAFLPGSPTYIPEIGHCTFKYGVTRNYVLHALWSALITLAVCLCIMYLRKLYREIFQWHDTNQMSLQFEEESDGRCMKAEHVRYIKRHCFGKVLLLGLILISFVLFWYPLFLLTLLDPKFHVSPTMYRVFTVFACFKSACTPWLIAAWTRGGFWCWKENVSPDFREDEAGPGSEVDLLENVSRYAPYLIPDDVASTPREEVELEDEPPRVQGAEISNPAFKEATDHPAPRRVANKSLYAV